MLLALVALLAIGLAVVNAAGRGPAVPVALAVVTVTLTLTALLLLAYRILNQPGPNDLVDVHAGAWLGLAALAAQLAGAFWSLKDEGPAPRRPAGARAGAPPGATAARS